MPLCSAFANSANRYSRWPSCWALGKWRHQNAGVETAHMSQFFIKDIHYWLLFFFGTGIAVKGFRFRSSETLVKLVSLFSLLVCSLGLNPHYYAYNLVTLYPLMAVFVALSVQWISEAGEHAHQQGRILPNGHDAAPGYAYGRNCVLSPAHFHGTPTGVATFHSRQYGPGPGGVCL